MPSSLLESLREGKPTSDLASEHVAAARAVSSHVAIRTAPLPAPAAVPAFRRFDEDDDERATYIHPGNPRMVELRAEAQERVSGIVPVKTAALPVAVEPPSVPPIPMALAASPVAVARPFAYTPPHRQWGWLALIGAVFALSVVVAFILAAIVRTL